MIAYQQKQLMFVNQTAQWKCELLIFIRRTFTVFFYHKKFFFFRSKSFIWQRSQKRNKQADSCRNNQKNK